MLILLPIIFLATGLPGNASWLRLRSSLPIVARTWVPRPLRGQAGSADATVVDHGAQVFHDADDFILGRILDLVRPEMLAARVLVLLQDDKAEVGISMRIRWMIRL
jgi:hypothetical protein